MPNYDLELNIEEMFMEVVREMNLGMAKKHMPVYSLDETLALKNMAELKKMAGIYNIHGYSKMNKARLIEAVTAAINDVSNMEAALGFVDDDEWELMQELFAQRYMVDKILLLNSYEYLHKYGYLELFNQEDHLYLVMPDEVQAVFARLSQSDFPVRRERYNLLNDYALAVTSLYGIISQDEFVELFNRHNENLTDADEVSEILLSFIACGVSNYCFWNEYIVNEVFEEHDFELVEVLAKATAGKTRYVPEKEELLRYADPDYFEDTKEMQTLRLFIMKNLCDEPELVDEVIAEIHELAAAEAGIQQMFDVLEEWDLLFTDENQVKEIIPLLYGVKNNTRSWQNKGYTFNELAAKKSDPFLKVITNQPQHAPKIGRNDPCPCGSDKKYKYCCGLNDGDL